MEYNILLFIITIQHTKNKYFAQNNTEHIETM